MSPLARWLRREQFLKLSPSGATSPCPPTSGHRGLKLLLSGLWQSLSSSPCHQSPSPRPKAPLHRTGPAAVPPGGQRYEKMASRFFQVLENLPPFCLWDLELISVTDFLCHHDTQRSPPLIVAFVVLIFGQSYPYFHDQQLCLISQSTF